MMLPTPGVRLELQRLVLVGFQIAAPDADQPVLWPAGLTTGHGIVLNMTDVRVVISSQELFSKYLDFFTKQNTLMWTVSTSWWAVAAWRSSRGSLNQWRRASTRGARELGQSYPA